MTIQGKRHDFVSQVHPESALPSVTTTPAAATDQPSAGQVDEPLPCPFCGGAPVVKSIAAGMAQIECPACGIWIDGFSNETRAAWNRRASLTPTAPQAASTPSASEICAQCGATDKQQCRTTNPKNCSYPNNLAPQAANIEGYSIKHVEGHGWLIDPPQGSRWVAFEDTPAGDFVSAIMKRAPQAASQQAGPDDEYAEYVNQCAKQGKKPMKFAAFSNFSFKAADFASQAATTASAPLVTPRDWPEDFSGENGMYKNACAGCKSRFLGHKNRIFCKACAATTASASEPRDLEGALRMVIRSRDILAAALTNVQAERDDLRAALARAPLPDTNKESP